MQMRAMPMMTLQSRAKNEDESAEVETAEKSYIVEGYAGTYEPYVLFQDDDGNDVYEQFTKENFENADRSDILLLYDHNGSNGVFGRLGKNLEVTVDDVGLYVRADLGLTSKTRELYEQIDSGLITKMSWAFYVKPDDYIYDKESRTIRYSQIRKIFDVSAVSRPANENTSIESARSFFNGVIEEEARSEAELINIRKRIALKIKTGGQLNV